MHKEKRGADRRPEHAAGTSSPERTLAELKAKYRGLERTLGEYSARYEAIIEAFDGLLYFSSHAYEVLSVNSRFLEELGTNPVGQKCYKAIHDLDDVCPWCVKDKVLQGETVRSELLSPRDKRYYNVVNTPVRHPDGTLSKMTMCHDITDQKKAEEQSQKMAKILVLDDLTGLLNRRFLFQRTSKELAEAESRGHPLSLVMFDVDDFKFYNDRNGHLAGDAALRSLAAVVRNTVRHMDYVARYGGEEFTAVFPMTTKKKAAVIGRRLQQQVERFLFPFKKHQPLGNLTVSLGLATFPEDAHDVESLIEAADQALYQAKAAGKNRLCLSKNSRGEGRGLG
ncbi:MAG: diguanylate cyclase [bacterium]|nr:diguanylate cyclase [bacterium]